MIPSVPKKLLLPEVPRYLRATYGQTVTRVTVYNWVKIGRHDDSKQFVKLRCAEGAMAGSTLGGPKPKSYTTTTWVNDFISKTTDWT